MAYSSVTINFTAVPAIDDVISINESFQVLNLNAIFKALRAVAGEVTIPSSDIDEYRMTISASASIDNIDVGFTPFSGGYTQVALASIMVVDNLDGTDTYILNSSTEPIIFETQTQTPILWEEGEFLYYGPGSGIYNEFISDTFKEAFDIDYNSAGLFTVISTVGDTNSGLGSVLITANFDNAVFSEIANTAPATITISNQIATPEVGSVAPETISFNVIGNIENTEEKGITITTNEFWEVTSLLPDWLELYQLNGTGNSNITASLKNYASLESGVISETIEITILDVTFMVMVTLTIDRFITSPFAADKLYFTKALEYLKFNSATPNTYVQFSIEIKVFKINTDEPLIYNRNNYKFPLFQGKGDFHIGTIVHGLLDEIKELSDFVPDFDSNYYKNQYRPAEISISFEEKSFGAVVPGLVSGTIPMFKMAKGHKPFMTDGQLALLTVAQQEVIRITPQSFIGTSFVYFGTPRIIVKKNNQIIEDFEIVPVVNKVIYSYFRFINDVKPGDSIELIVVKELETRTQRFVCFKNGLESTYFFFENDNGVIEPFEFSGRRRVNSNFKHLSTTKFKDLYSIDSKVKTEISQSIIVNTGQLGKSEHRVISALIGSAKVWCSLDDPKGPYFKVDSTTTKIMNQDTSSSDEGFDIEFNLLENADASIYPR